MKKKNRHGWLQGVVSLLVVVGLLLICAPFIKESLIGLQLSQKKIITLQKTPETMPIEETIQPPSLAAVTKNLEIESVSGYGFVQIPALDFQQPLFIGITNQNLLSDGAVMYPERSLETDNFVVFGHHLGIQSLLFGKLLSAELGMQISLLYLEEKVNYSIVDIKIVEETDLSVLTNTSTPQLTMITCPSASRTTERLVVTAIPLTAQGDKEEETKKDISAEFIVMEQRQINQWRKQSWLAVGVLLLVLLLVIFCLLLIHYYFKRIEASNQ